METIIQFTKLSLPFQNTRFLDQFELFTCEFGDVPDSNKSLYKKFWQDCRLHVAFKYLKVKHPALSTFAFPDAQRAQRGASSCENLVRETVANFSNGPLCLKPERAVLGHERDGFD